MTICAPMTIHARTSVIERSPTGDVAIYAMRSLITSDAMMSPATDGTKAQLAGTGLPPVAPVVELEAVVE